MKLRRVLVVYKKSALQLYNERRRDPDFWRLMRSRHPATARFHPNHENHTSALEEVRRILDARGIDSLFVYRASSFTDAGFDLVLTVGGDGTFLDAAQSVTRAPMLGLNSSPCDSVGLFCGVRVETLGAALDAIGRGRSKPAELARLRIRVAGKDLGIRALNDILVTHANPAATSKFLLACRGRRQEFKSSGIWVAPAAGSTAAIASAGGTVLPVGSARFQFLVREPYLPDGRKRGMVQGILEAGESLVLHSRMRSGRIYVDGPHRDFPFPLGAEAVISARAPRLRVFCLDRKRRKGFAR